MTNPDVTNNLLTFVLGLVLGMPIGWQMMWNRVNRDYFMRKWPEVPNLLKRTAEDRARERSQAELEKSIGAPRMYNDRAATEDRLLEQAAKELEALRKDVDALHEKENAAYELMKWGLPVRRRRPDEPAAE